MSRITVPSGAVTEAFIGGVLGAVTLPGATPAPVQLAVLQAVVTRFARHDPPPSVERIGRWDAAAVRLVLTDPADRATLAHAAVALELLVHPLPDELEAHVEHYLRSVGVEAPYVAITRDTAREHLGRLHADLIRNSWYTHRTIEEIFHGHLRELARSKLSYYAIGDDQEIARRWRSLEECPEGSWGAAVADFYHLHRFPYPGEPHGIYEVGALHDWVHVLADYATDAEGEIDVFAFIAGTMADGRGFVQFIFTLALFQNASVDTVGGIHIPIARADTLSDPGAADRLADALWRAAQCTADPMAGVDHFALADTSLDELRERWNLPPRTTPGPGALTPGSARDVRIDLSAHPPADG